MFGKSDSEFGEISEHEMQELKRWFEAIDTKGQGYLTKNEISKNLPFLLFDSL